MRLKIFLLLFLTIINYSLGQNNYNQETNNSIVELVNKGDSLNSVKKYKNAFVVFNEALDIALVHKDTIIIASIYKKLGINTYRLKEYTNAEKFYKNSIKYDGAIKNAADNYFNVSLVKRKLNQNDSVLVYLDKSLSLYKKIEPTNATYNTYLTAGIIYKNRQLFDKSLEFLVLAYHGYKKNENSKQLVKVLNTMGAIQNRLKNYDQALKYQFEALNLKEKLGQTRQMALNYNNIAMIYKNLEKKDSAVSNYRKALKLINPTDSEFGITKYNIANLHNQEGDIELAKEEYKASIVANKFQKDTLNLLFSYNGITDLYLDGDFLNIARKYLDSSIVLVQKVTNKISHLNYYSNVVSYHTKTNEYRLALDYQKRYSNLYEEIYDLKQTELVQEMQSRFDYEKKENEILKLTLANKESQLLIAQKNESIRGKNFILMILSFLIIISVVGYYMYAQKQKGIAQKQKIERLEAVQIGQENIKKRIARDLHDIITSNFDGLRLKILALVKSKKPKALIETITQEISDINQQIRLVSHRLSPLNFHTHNRPFNEILKSQLSEFQLYRKIFINLEQPILKELNKLQSDRQNNLYGIILEILNNVAKHSLATQLNISNVIDSNNWICFKFQDNGIGINAKHKRGIGLLNIEQRTELLKGTCSIKKTTIGTEVIISFPLNI